ncbi:MAG: orotate phosphoribosyltransferase [Bacteriovoracaceae bacterium]
MREEKVAHYLLDCEAVFLKPQDPFIWASGIKSPIYCDNRQMISMIEARKFVTDSFVELIKKNYPEVDVVAGTSTAGIAWAAWIADRMEKPMVYVRSSKKEHGRENLIEGKIKAGQKVIVIEDLISTGGSSMKVIEALKADQAQVLALMSIFSYEFKKATELFSNASVKVHVLCNFSTLLNVAISKGTIRDNEAQDILQWKSQF